MSCSCPTVLGKVQDKLCPAEQVGNGPKEQGEKVLGARWGLASCYQLYCN